MKENISSVEYANKWYGGGWEEEIPNNLELLQASLTLEDNPLFLLENISQNLELSSQSLIEILSLSGETLIELIQTEIDQLAQKAKEQVASLFLRKKFGEPGDPMVSVVFAQLAQREVLTKKDSRESANEVAKLTERFEKQILSQFKILIANQINKIEKERKKYVEAEKTSNEIGNQTPEITEQMQGYRPKFAEKFKDFEEQKKSLTNLYKKIDTYLLPQNNRVVFELAKQGVSPTSL
jgi:hypothetical protein